MKERIETLDTFPLGMLNAALDEIERNGATVAQAIDLAVKKTELGVQPGLTINFMRYNNLGAASALVEGVRMQTNALTASQFSITCCPSMDKRLRPMLISPKV